MKVKELITSYGGEELGIKICDSETNNYLIPHIWRTDWLLVNPDTKEYVCKSFHQYDDIDVYSWEMFRGELFIYVEV